MPTLGLDTEIADRQVYGNTVERFRTPGIVLPTLNLSFRVPPWLGSVSWLPMPLRASG